MAIKGLERSLGHTGNKMDDIVMAKVLVKVARPTIELQHNNCVYFCINKYLGRHGNNTRVSQLHTLPCDPCIQC